MKDFIEYIVKNLVDSPDEVVVEVFEGKENTIIEVKVDPEDVGKLIGKQGRNIRALRSIASTVGSGPQRKVKLELIQVEEEATV